jgi:hypothetical protein
MKTTRATKAPTSITGLILWMRSHSIAWDSLTVGNVTISGSDLRLSESLPKPKAEDRPTKAPTIMDRYGAALMEDATKSDGMNSVVEEDE